MNKGLLLVASIFIIVMSVVAQQTVFTVSYIDANSSADELSSINGRVLGASTSGLVGYWNFDETGGTTAADLSGNGDSGTLIGTSTFVGGKFGNALQVSSGGRSQVAAAGSINNLNSFTWSVWVNVSGTFDKALAAVMEKGTGSAVVKSLSFYNTGGSNSAKVFAKVRTGTTDALSITNTNAYTTGTWEHWAITYSDSGDRLVHIYKNGVEVSYSSQTVASGTLLTESTYPFSIGATPGSGFYGFNGSLDEARVYNRVLSANEIAEIYADTSPSMGTTPSTPSSPPTGSGGGTSNSPAPPTTQNSIGVQAPSYSLGSPIVYFTDLVSGPSTGNSDNSLGQQPGEDGSIVTLWGANLGASQGASKVYVNGYEARVYTWGNALAPANLYAKLGAQMVSFQIPHSVSAGSALIQVQVNGKFSNTLPFNIRSGNIYFVKTSGSDSTGDGTWSRPWGTIPGAAKKISSGDIAYIGDGVNQNVLDGYGSVNLGSSGLPDAPKALVVYPGASSSVGTDDIDKGFSNWQGGTIGYSSGWVISKFVIHAKTNTIMNNGDVRIVGNFLTAPNADGPTGGVTISGNNLYFLGNEETNVGKYGASKLFHPLYISGKRASSGARLPEETNREVAWNYFHDNHGIRTINIYSEGASSAFISNHRVHDNYIENQSGEGLLVGYYTIGTTQVYNNVFVNAGGGPDPLAGDYSSHASVFLYPGYDATTPTTLNFYNNTIVNCGWPGNNLSGCVLITNTNRYNLDFKNNLFSSNGEPYIMYWTDKTVLATASNNLWFGSGAVPTWDSTALGVDPLFTNVAALSANSPAINKGADVASVVKTDILGNYRPQGSSFDIGAYEYASGYTGPVVSNPTGGGTTGGGTTSGGGNTGGTGGTTSGGTTGGGTGTTSSGGNTGGTTSSSSGGTTSSGSGSNTGSSTSASSSGNSSGSNSNADNSTNVTVTYNGPHLIIEGKTFYYVEDGQKKGITSPGILKSYGLAFSDAVSASTEDQNLPQGPLLLPGEGSLVRSPSNTTVYLISAGKRYGFSSAAVFTGKGFKFSSILIVSEPELMTLPEGGIENNSQSAHLPGLDISDNGTIYWIDNNGTKHAYASLEVYNSWHVDNDFSAVVPANDSDRQLPVGDTVTPRIIN